MKETIQYRVRLFELLAIAQALGASRELSLAVTCLQSGRMLLGTVAQLLGSPNPYPQADNPASPVIHPVADTKEIAHVLLPKDPIEAVKVARVNVQGLIDDMTAWRRVQWPRPYGTLEEALYDRALGDVILAKQWLGEQLAVIAGHPVVKPRMPLRPPATVSIVEASAPQSLPTKLTKKAAPAAEPTPEPEPAHDPAGLLQAAAPGAQGEPNTPAA